MVLVEAVILIYNGSEIKNIIIQHEKHAGTDFENCREYSVFNKTLKEKDILKYLKVSDMHKAISQSLHTFSWPEIRFIFLQYKLGDNSTLKLKLRPLSENEPETPLQWQAYGRSIPFFTFKADYDKDHFIRSFELQLNHFLG